MYGASTHRLYGNNTSGWSGGGGGSHDEGQFNGQPSTASLPSLSTPLLWSSTTATVFPAVNTVPIPSAGTPDPLQLKLRAMPLPEAPITAGELSGAPVEVTSYVPAFLCPYLYLKIAKNSPQKEVYNCGVFYFVINQWDKFTDLLRRAERESHVTVKHTGKLCGLTDEFLPTQFGTGTGSNTDSMDLDDQRNHPLDDFVFDSGRFWDPQGHKVLFPAGDPNAENHEALHLEAQLKRRLASLDSGNDPEFGSTSNSLHDSDSEDRDIDDPTVSEPITELQMLGIEDSDDDESDAGDARVDEDINWAPHGSRTVKQRVQNTECALVLRIEKKQATLTREVNISPRMHTSALGNKYYMNHPIDLLALVYPEVTTMVSQLYHASKWLEKLDLDDLSPMWANWEVTGHCHFYIKELAQMAGGQFVIPLKWVLFSKVEHVECYQVSRSLENNSFQSNIFVIESHEIIRIPATDLKFNVLDLLAQGINLDFAGEGYSQQMQIFSNLKTTKISLQAGQKGTSIQSKELPMENQYSIYASCPGVTMSLEIKPGKYHQAYDCLLEQDILFRIDPHCLPADNPAQAESSSGSGAKSNYRCRYDKSGGTAAERETDEGYHAQFEPGIPRTPAETIATIKEQIFVACLGVQEAVDTIQTRTGVKDKIAVFWIEQLITKA
ncbi:hypothetical protein B0H14DRAFT_2618933 [Mycena olivaceomarginata]|nr:hypothetical protein B0H14DRAFT_2618933 [Mycena olivaceomarginata]